jgi:Mg-chelatase subunit ChlD
MQYTVLRTGKVKDYIHVTADQINPSGGTPLNDAIVRMLDMVLAEKPKKAVVVIMTDGGENSSQLHQASTVRARIQQCSELGIEIIYLGANFAGVDAEGARMGLVDTRTVNMTQQNYGQTMSDLATRSVVYATSKSVADGAVAMNYTESDKLKAVKK